MKGRSPPLEIIFGCGVVKLDPPLELLAPDGDHVANTLATAAASLLIASFCSNIELGLGVGNSFVCGGDPLCPEGGLLLRAINDFGPSPSLLVVVGPPAEQSRQWQGG